MNHKYYCEQLFHAMYGCEFSRSIKVNSKTAINTVVRDHFLQDRRRKLNAATINAQCAHDFYLPLIVAKVQVR